MGVGNGPGPESATLVREFAGHAGIANAAARTHDCARPVRLRGSTRLVDIATGEARMLYSSGAGAGRLRLAALR